MKYSFTLFEKTPEGVRCAMQTDNTDQPFDINEGSKLELGSTAKLGVLTTYLEIVTELHGSYGTCRPRVCARSRSPSGQHQPLGHFYLINARDRSLPVMLEAALDRKYSASPYEGFLYRGRHAHLQQLPQRRTTVASPYPRCLA